MRFFDANIYDDKNRLFMCKNNLCKDMNNLKFK